MIWEVNSQGSPIFSISGTQMSDLEQTFCGNVFKNKH